MNYDNVLAWMFILIVFGLVLFLAIAGTAYIV